MKEFSPFRICLGISLIVFPHHLKKQVASTEGTTRSINWLLVLHYIIHIPHFATIFFCQVIILPLILSESSCNLSQGEFNSGTFINALLGRQYLQEGVVPTTNEITLLSYSEVESESFERCERHPDGQFMCYLSVPILKEVSIELLLTVMLIFLLYLTDVCIQLLFGMLS
jgi:hypothetical protein